MVDSDTSSLQNMTATVTATGNDSLLPLSVAQLHYEVEESTLIDNVSLTIQPGDITVIMGYNGAGKSLLLRLMHGLLQPTSGQVLWNAQAVNERHRLRQAMVFQKPTLLRRSVLANLEFILASRDIRDNARSDALLSLVDLQHCAKRPARKLSGGEQQRLAIAMALAHQPEILFLDEVTASLDPASTASIERIIKNVASSGCTVVMVSHDIPQAARLADRILFLHNGAMEFHGAAARFFTNNGNQMASAYLAGKHPDINIQVQEYSQQ